jgi:hypothetical protein
MLFFVEATPSLMLPRWQKKFREFLSQKVTTLQLPLENQKTESFTLRGLIFHGKLDSLFCIRLNLMKKKKKRKLIIYSYARRIQMQKPYVLKTMTKSSKSSLLMQMMKSFHVLIVTLIVQVTVIVTKNRWRLN